MTDSNIDDLFIMDLKVGYFGTVVGYEVYEYTGKLGFFMEPTHHTGLLHTN